jgi:spore coat protein U-like protein
MGTYPTSAPYVDRHFGTALLPNAAMKRSHSHLPFAALATLLFGLVLSGAAQAATSCTINTTGAVAFGAYDWKSAVPTDSAGTITYTCDGGALIILSQGSSGTYTQRTMVSGANQLGYNLYVDAARTQVWGDFSGGTTIKLVGAGALVAVPVYGRMPTAQNVPPGSYADTVTVTFFF